MNPNRINHNPHHHHHHSNKNITQTMKRQRAAAHRLHDLKGVEERLFAAHQGALRRGDYQRAAAYKRQLLAARTERSQWLEYLNRDNNKALMLINSSSSNNQISTYSHSHSSSSSSSCSSSHAQIIAAALCLMSPFFDSMAGFSTRRMSHALLAVAMLLFATFISNPPTNTTINVNKNRISVNPSVRRPQPWSQIIADSELKSKLYSSPKLNYIMRNKY